MRETNLPQSILIISHMQSNYLNAYITRTRWKGNVQIAEEYILNDKMSSG